MNLFADENVDAPIISRLRADGHLVVAVAELSPSISDEEVLRQANESQALLVTGDKDFGELVYQHRQVHAGVVLLRLDGLSAEAKAEIVSEALTKHGSEMLDAFSVISSASVRIRRKQKPR